MNNWIVTLPATTDWVEYEKELAACADRSHIMSYRLPYKPKGMQYGDRCYITHKGLVRGYMEILQVIEKEAFTCSTTGTPWRAGWYMERTGTFTKSLPWLQPYKGFRGIRRYEPETEEKKIQTVETLGMAQERPSV